MGAEAFVERSSLNDGWSYRPRGTDRFAERTAGTPERSPVTLPHDAMIRGERSTSAGAASGFFHGGIWEYQRALDLVADPDRTVVLEFEGVYRDAEVWVNGALAARRPYGYSDFYVPIDHLLRPDSSSEVRVEARAGGDSRWYSGAGIYRNVWLWTAGRVHFAPDGVEVRTAAVDDGGAEIVLSAHVLNASTTQVVATLRVEVCDGA